MAKDSGNNVLVIVVAVVTVAAIGLLYWQFRPKNYTADATSSAAPGMSTAKPGMLGKPQR